MINKVLAEFRASAIPDRLTTINVSWLDGDLAVETMAEWALGALKGNAQQYATKPVQRILAQYRHAADGGWVAYGDGGVVPYFKPLNPRMSHQQQPGGGMKIKAVKYETPQGAPGLPLLPVVDDETAQKIYRRFQINPPASMGFWDAVRTYNLPVAITEGFKKALALIAHLQPAIALRGVTMWHPKGDSASLHPEIERFVSANIFGKRQMPIVFDQDPKSKTQRYVRNQIIGLAKLLQSRGVSVSVPTWGLDLGKGIDDVLRKVTDLGQVAPSEWLSLLIDRAPSLADYRRDGKVAAAIGTIEALNRLSFPLERETTGEYMPELPELIEHAIHVVDATMNSGKTWRIGRDWVGSALAKGWHVLVLAPLNSLGQQTARDWGLQHIHGIGEDGGSQREFWESIRKRPGVVMCPDSIGKLPQWFLAKPILLILDEANQVTTHITQGDTLKSRYSAVLQTLQEIAVKVAENGGAIVLSEDGIPDRCVNYWRTLSGLGTVRAFRHRKQAQPWDCEHITGDVSGFRAQLLEAAGKERLLFVATSQREGRRFERAINQTHPSRKVVRIDSETNEGGAFKGFFRAPDEWLRLAQPDVLILSPSAKSGVSIQGGVAAELAYFESVWGYFPSLDTDTHLQLLGRFRPAVPRHFYCPEFIVGSGDESLLKSQAIREKHSELLQTAARLFQITPDQEELAELELAILNYQADSSAVSGNQKAIASEALIRRLEASGHHVTISQTRKSTPTAELWKEIQEALWREDAAQIAQTEIAETQDTAWARRTLDSLDASQADRIAAYKILYREQFPGVSFDDPQDCYEALCKDWGLLHRGITLQAKAEHLAQAKSADKEAAEAVLKGIRAAHRLPTGYIKAALIHHLGVLELMGEGEQWSNADSRCEAIKALALKYAAEIRYWLRLNVNAEQTPVEVVNKLVRKLGIEPVALARPGQRIAKRDRIYGLPPNPVRLKLLEAARNKASGMVSTICKSKDLSTNQIVDTGQKPHPEAGWVGALVRWGASLSEWFVVAVEDGRATLQNAVNPSYGYKPHVSLSELTSLSAA